MADWCNQESTGVTSCVGSVSQRPFSLEPEARPCLHLPQSNQFLGDHLQVCRSDRRAKPTVGLSDQLPVHEIDDHPPNPQCGEAEGSSAISPSRALVGNGSTGQSQGYQNSDLFLYLDPPFYHEASRLYNCFFCQDDHKTFHDELLQLDIPYLLSYDPAKEIRQMYSHNGQGPKRIDLLYTAASTNQQHAQELVITNLASLPKGTRIWRSKEEWNTKRR